MYTIIRHLTRRPRASKHSPACQNARATAYPSCRQASWKLFPQIAPGGRSTRRGNGEFTGRRLQSVATPSIAASTAAGCHGSLRQPAWWQRLVGEHRRDQVHPDNSRTLGLAVDTYISTRTKNCTHLNIIFYIGGHAWNVNLIERRMTIRQCRVSL